MNSSLAIQSDSSFRGRNPFDDFSKVYEQLTICRTIIKYYQFLLILLLVICSMYSYYSLMFRHQHYPPLSKNLNKWLLSSPGLPVISYFFANNENIIIITIYYLANFFIMVYKLPLDQPFIISIRAGLVSGVNVPLLYILPLKSGPLSLLMSRSYENLLIYHKFVGSLCIFMAGFHMIAFCFTLNWGYILTDRACLTGIFCFTAFLMIAITSINYIRRNYYELFYIVHIVCFISFLPVFYFHHFNCKPFVCYAVISLIFDRLIRWVWKFWILNCKILSFNNEVIILSIDSNIDNLTPFYRAISFLLFFKSTNSRLKWNNSDHLFLNIPSIKLFQSHPFTISTISQTRNPVLVIKICSNFTKELYKSLPKRNFICLIHGPYGSSSRKFPPMKYSCKGMPYSFKSLDSETTSLTTTTNVKSYSRTPSTSTESSTESENFQKEKIVLVAGGVGISFILPIFHYYYDNLKYSISIIWIIKNDNFLELIDLNKEVCDIKIWCTSSQGRPQIDQLIYDQVALADFSKIHLISCGPNSLIKSLEQFTKTTKHDINLITEEFTF